MEKMIDAARNVIGADLISPFIRGDQSFSAGKDGDGAVVVEVIDAGDGWISAKLEAANLARIIDKLRAAFAGQPNPRVVMVFAGAGVEMNVLHISPRKQDGFDVEMMFFDVEKGEIAPVV